MTTTYTVTVTSGAHGTTDPEPDDYPIDENETIILEAVPAEGYVFDGWTIDGVHKTFTNPYTFTITKDVTINANFRLYVAMDSGEKYYYYKTPFQPLSKGVY